MTAPRSRPRSRRPARPPSRSPQLRVLPDLEQRDVAAPRVAADDGALGVGDPAVDEVLEPGVHVLELRAADVADQRVAPLAAVPDRAAVVDHARPRTRRRRTPAPPAASGRSRATSARRGRTSAPGTARRSRPASRRSRARRWPCGFSKCQDSYGRPAGARPSPERGALRRCRRGRAAAGGPARARNQTRPSGRTRAFQTKPGSVATGSSAPSRGRSDRGGSDPRSVFVRRSADPSGHQSATMHGPSRSGVEIVRSPVARSQIPGRSSPSRSWSNASRWSPGDGRPALRVQRHALVAQFADRRRPSADRRPGARGGSGRRARSARGRGASRPPRARRRGRRPRRRRGTPTRASDGSRALGRPSSDT